MSRWHVEANRDGRCVNRTAFATKALAVSGKAEMEREDKAHNSGETDIEERLLASLMDRDNSDECPFAYHPRIQFDYTYTIEKCTFGNTCLACYEGGFTTL